MQLENSKCQRWTPYVWVKDVVCVIIAQKWLFERTWVYYYLHILGTWNVLILSLVSIRLYDQDYVCSSHIFNFELTFGSACVLDLMQPQNSCFMTRRSNFLNFPYMSKFQSFCQYVFTQLDTDVQRWVDRLEFHVKVATCSSSFLTSPLYEN